MPILPFDPSKRRKPLPQTEEERFQELAAWLKDATGLDLSQCATKADVQRLHQKVEELEAYVDARIRKARRDMWRICAAATAFNVVLLYALDRHVFPWLGW